MAFLQEGSLSYEILIALKDLGSDLAYFSFINPPTSLRSAMYHLDRRMERRTRTKGISQLKRQGFVREYKKHGERYLQLTQKARVEIVRYRLKQKTKEVWDKKWRIVVFDVPEATRKDRDFLRSQLKWLGFLELQKSVWIFPYEVKDDLQEFIKLCKLKLMGDIRFLTVEHIDEDKDLLRHFGLR